jgi:FkbM family methyltransferase
MKIDTTDPKNIYKLIDELNIPEIYKLRSLQNFMFRYNIEPKVIFDLGARDLYESIWFANAYPESQVHSFECNPDMADLCRVRSAFFPNITLVEKAVSDIDGTLDFYPINVELTKQTPNIPYYIAKDGNPGASSMFKSLDPTYKQNKVTVESIRLNTYLSENEIEEIDLLWMDIQGAEKIALQSLNHYLHKVKMIHTEVAVGPNTEYEGGASFDEVNTLLTNNGFALVGKGEIDMIYVNTSYANNKI